MRRRAFSGAAGALLGTAVGARRAAGATPDWKQEAPDHVTFTFDQSWLETYRPLLVTRELEQANVIGLFAMKATSPEWEVDVGIYAMAYATQDGALAPPIGFDSHFGDHEWFYSYVDSDTGDLSSATWAAYHWIAGRAQASALPMKDETHPKAHVDPRWHNYYLTEEEGTFVDLEDLTTAFQSWLDNGMDEHLYLPAITRPVVMRERESWWKSGLDASYAALLYDVGLAGADNANPVIA